MWVRPVKPHIGHINTIQFRQKELCYVATSSTSNCWPAPFSKWWFIDAASPKFTLNSNTLWMYLLFGDYKSNLRTTYTAILAINKSIILKMCLIAEDDFVLKSVFSYWCSTQTLHCSESFGFSCCVNWILVYLFFFTPTTIVKEK